MAEVDLNWHNVASKEDERLVLQLKRDEAATVWYALLEYKTTLENKVRDTLNESEGGAGYYEELMFLYTHLGKITSLMFDIRDNHAPSKLDSFDGTNPVRKWLDVS